MVKKIITIFFLIVIAVAAYESYKYFNPFLDELTDPEKVTEAFYNDWTNYLNQNPDKNPLEERIYEGNLYLTEAFIEKLNRLADSSEEKDYDPILCSREKLQSFTIKESSLSENEAEVFLREEFLENEKEIKVLLKLVDDRWKIEDVVCDLEARDEFNFSEEGNLLINSPGLETETWYLSYEKPGSPGLTIELSFDEESKCYVNGETDCQLFLEGENLAGKRVILKGLTEEDGILVRSLEIKKEQNNEENGEENNEEDNNEETDQQDGYPKELETISRSWIVNSCPTYVFDGMGLKFIEGRKSDMIPCENCYEMEFTFNSRNSGYGNRTGEVVAQVITPHRIVVLMRDNKVNKAVTDQKYDEINEVFIQD